jgi:hypothetical protein
MLKTIPSFHTTFIIKWCWILSKAFSASIELINWFLSLPLLMCCITFIELCMLNHPCIPGMKPTWLSWMIFLMCCWIWFTMILLRIFASMFKGNWPVVLLFGGVFVWFWDECNIGFKI